MYQKSFVVLAYPRTGSTLVVSNLNAYFNIDAAHTHNPDWVPPHENYTCVVTRRANVFETMCSHFIGIYSAEGVVYSNKHLEPFRVPANDMERYLLGFYDFYRRRNLSYYKQVVEIDFDSLISDPYYLFGQFNITEKTNYMIQKCPYRYQDLIINIDELWSIYESISQKQ